MNKCENCKVQRRVEESEEPACCAWFLENVVVGGKDVEECPEYEPI